MILAGVGGQGILSIAYVLDHAALRQNLHVKQADVHGMAQRGGAVQSHSRIADRAIHSDLIPAGAAGMILGVEPLESLRYTHLLSPEGTVVSTIAPHRSIPDYPAISELLTQLEGLPNVVLIDSDRLARMAGSPKAHNMVMAGAAVFSLPIEAANAEKASRRLFASKGDRIVEVNLRAFRLGAAFFEIYRELAAIGVQRERIRRFSAKLGAAGPTPESLRIWGDLLCGDGGGEILSSLESQDLEVTPEPAAIEELPHGSLGGGEAERNM
ncbi:MAG: hypothetical protein CME06_01455 [Gemmatimonadetes bacterium]|nr:hypothetical protein [Gemmatimonadota bacterium]